MVDPCPSLKSMSAKNMGSIKEPESNIIDGVVLKPFDEVLGHAHL